MSKPKPFCEICKCQIPTESLIESHKEGKKHLKWKSLKEAHEKTQQCSVFVRDFVRTDDVDSALLSYFSEFGNVDDIYIDKEKCSYAFVEFSSPETVKILLQKSKDDLPLYQGQQLIIKQRLVKDWSPPHKSVKVRRNEQKKKATCIGLVDILKSGNMKTGLDSIKNVNDKLLYISSAVAATDEEKQLCELVCKLLEEVFVELYSDAKIVMFGSTATDYRSRGSDLDVTILSDLLPENPKFFNPNKCGIKDVAEYESVLEQKLIDEFDFICTSLRRCVSGISVIRCITNAHCPVIKLSHSSSNLQIDLTVNNRLAAKNTELLMAYSECNASVKHIVQLIRVWSKSKSLSGYKSTTISNYALTLMVIHYLQNCQIFELPVLQQSKQDPSVVRKDIIHGWDCSFKKMSPIEEEFTNYVDILLGFFDYYLSFDFEKDVISIRSIGTETIVATEEELLMICGTDVSVGFTSPMIVQDPFELLRNVTFNVSKQALEKFQDEWILARDIIQRSIDNHPGAILNLFTVKSSDEKSPKLAYDFQIPATYCQTDLLHVKKLIKELLEKHFSMQCEWLDGQAQNEAMKMPDDKEPSSSPPMKRQRMIDNGSAQMLKVIAVSNTWTKQRQLRRQQKMQAVKSISTTTSECVPLNEIDSMSDSCSVGSIDRDQLKENEVKPILIILLNIDVSGKIMIRTRYAKTLNLMQSFYAIFKKLCMGAFESSLTLV